MLGHKRQPGRDGETGSCLCTSRAVVRLCAALCAPAKQGVLSAACRVSQSGSSCAGSRPAACITLSSLAAALQTCHRLTAGLQQDGP